MALDGLENLFFGRDVSSLQCVRVFARMLCSAKRALERGLRAGPLGDALAAEGVRARQAPLGNAHAEADGALVFVRYC